MIDLPYTFGEKVRATIDRYRDKHKLPTPEEIKKLYNKNEHFLEEELDLVEELYITEDSINYLHLFKNVKRLIIACSHQFTDTEVQELINRFPNLVSLEVSNQNQISYINLNNQPNIEELTIRSNKNLIRIVGFKDLQNLDEINIYDNPSLSEVVIKVICSKALRDALYGTTCNLDLLYMPELLKVMPNTISFDQLELLDIKWIEQLKDNTKIERLKHKTKEAAYIYEKAKEVIERYIRDTDTPKQKFAIINELLCQNVKYDHDGMDREVNISNGQQRGKKGGTNSCANALILKTCVCQGYTKAAQLLLKLCGITSYDVGCVATTDESKIRTMTFGEKKIDYTDHSIIRICFPDFTEYYSDITWDAKNVQRGKSRKYFLLSKDDISKDHKLEGEDDVNTSSISILEEEELLEFARRRIAEIEEKKVTK